MKCRVSASGCSSLRIPSRTGTLGTLLSVFQNAFGLIDWFFFIYVYFTLIDFDAPMYFMYLANHSTNHTYTLVWLTVRYLTLLYTTYFT